MKCTAPSYKKQWISGPLDVVFWSFIIGVFILVGFAVAANAQPQHEHSGVAGKFYAGWNQMPDRQSSCCDLKDCYFTLFKTEGGTVFALKRQKITEGEVITREPIEQAVAHAQWVVIPADKLEENAADPMDSPDGLNHVCMGESGYVYCAVRGGGQ